MANFLMTLAEERDATTRDHFAVRYKVDEEDCFDFANGLVELGHDVYFVNWEDFDGTGFTRMFHRNGSSFVTPIPLTRVDLAFVYKMEGFLLDMPRFFEMVERLAQIVPRVVNHPATIRHNIDKCYLMDLARRGINIIPTGFMTDAVRERLANGKACVLKPMCGERGNGVVLARTIADLAPIKDKQDKYLAQDYMPEIRDGERSLVYLGRVFQHAVIKRPPIASPDEFRCNESLGGTVNVYEPTSSELAFAEQVLSCYEAMGYPAHFSRIDMLATSAGPALLEAELLNPSIYANYSKIGPQFGRKLAAYLDGLAASPLHLAKPEPVP